MDFTIDELNYLLSAMERDEDEWTTKRRANVETQHRVLYDKIESLIATMEAE